MDITLEQAQEYVGKRIAIIYESAEWYIFDTTKVNCSNDIDLALEGKMIYACREDKDYCFFPLKDVAHIIVIEHKTPEDVYKEFIGKEE